MIASQPRVVPLQVGSPVRIKAGAADWVDVRVQERAGEAGRVLLLYGPGARPVKALVAFDRPDLAPLLVRLEHLESLSGPDGPEEEEWGELSALW